MNNKNLFFLAIFFCATLVFPCAVSAVTAEGGWSAQDKVRQSGGIKLSFPAGGGAASGTFSGSAGNNMFQYSGTFSGEFSGGWNGTFSGEFSGKYSSSYKDPVSGKQVNMSGGIGGPWNGKLKPDGTISAKFDNKAKYGLEGGANLNYSTESFEEEYGSPPGEEKKDSEKKNLGKKTLKIVGLDGKPVEGGKVSARMKDGKIIELEIKNGEVNFDANLVESLYISGPGGAKIQISPENLGKGKVVLANWENWKKYLQEKLKNLAKILNGGRETNLDDYFSIDWEATSNEYSPPAFDILRRFGVKDEIKFYPGYIEVEGDVSTPVHEALGHGITEVVGEGNEFKYAGGPHDDPWQPTFNERSRLNPVRWFSGKTGAVSDERARGFAMSEGWAQYIGDKWNRDLTGTPDEESEYTLEKAKEKIEWGKAEGGVGKLYAGQAGYGAKVENVVATAFNSLYAGKTLEEAVSDFQAVREQYKAAHGGETFQNINEYLNQKMEMAADEKEKEKIQALVRELDFE
jgi:hypothetical protein